jgi:flagellar hook-associated protein 2
MAIFTDRMRYTGLSGVDTGAMVEAIMRAESLRLDRLKQTRQRTVWQQEALRTHVNSINAFRASFLDILNPNSMRRESTFRSTVANVTTSGGQASNAVSVRTTAETPTGTYNLSIQQLAQSDVFRSAQTISGRIEGSEAFNAENIKQGDSINVTLDGRTVRVEFDADFFASMGDPPNNAGFVTALNERLDAAFGKTNGEARVAATLTGDQRLTFSTNGNHTLSLSNVRDDTANILTTQMGIANNSSNTFSLDQKLSDVSSQFSATSLVINGRTIDIGGDITVRQFMEAINNSDAGVRMSYESISQGFRLEGTATGALNGIKFDGDTSDFFKDVFHIDGSAASHISKAQDALFNLNGVSFVRERNDVTIDVNANGGRLSLTLNQVTDTAGTNAPDTRLRIEVGRNTDAAFDAIKSFVEAYNKLIDGINGAVNERRARTGSQSFYEPLTDAQREAMSDREIEQWETKAKQGILGRDQSLSDFTSRLRSQLWQPVNLGDGRGISLFEIGITGSSNHTDQGKLVIDETALRAALANRGDDIAALFTKDGTGHEVVGGRRLENRGLAERFEDIFRNTVDIHTRVEADGSRVTVTGSLVRRVGNEILPTSLMNNEFFHLMKRQDDQLADMLLMLRRKEEAHYARFSKMESAIMSSTSQMTYLQSMLGL